MRISSAGAVLLLAACSQGDAEATAAGGTDGLIECALAGAADFTRVCSVERTAQAGGVIVTVRHPDGGFRRFLASYDDSEGPGGPADAFDTLDGAQRAVVNTMPAHTDVSVGDDRYRFDWNEDPRAER